MFTTDLFRIFLTQPNINITPPLFWNDLKFISARWSLFDTFLPFHSLFSPGFILPHYRSLFIKCLIFMCHSFVFIFSPSYISARLPPEGRARTSLASSLSVSLSHPRSSHQLPRSFARLETPPPPLPPPPLSPSPQISKISWHAKAPHSQMAREQTH